MDDEYVTKLRPIYMSEGVSVWALPDSADNDAETNRLLDSGCLGKEVFPTPTACIAAIKLYNRPALDYYRCRFCQSYHLTSKGGDGS